MRDFELPLVFEVMGIVIVVMGVFGCLFVISMISIGNVISDFFGCQVVKFRVSSL